MPWPFSRKRAPVEERALTRETVPAIFFRHGAAGEPVTTRNALAVADVWACVRVLAQTAGTLPLHAYRRTGAGRERVRCELLEQPSPGMPEGTFVAWAVLTLALWGECFVGKYRSGDRLVALGLLAPDRVEVTLGHDGEPVYGYVDPVAGAPRLLTRADVCHVRLLTTDGVRGVSPISQCRDALSAAVAMSRHAGDSASSGYRPDGVVTVREGPGAWEDKHSKPGRTAFVTSEVTYTPVGLPAKDAEFVAQRQLSTVEVCRIFGVPPWMVGAPSGDSLTYANTEGQASAFVKFGLAGYIAPLEQALSLDRDVMPPGDTYCAFGLDALLRPDSAGRAAFYTAALHPETGWLTRAEARALEDLPTERTADA
jgi:HK97 family phage portal protein